MMKHILIILMIMGGTIAKAQTEYDQAISQAFQEYKKAYFDVDRAKLLHMAHPNVVEIGGGPDYYIEELTHDYNMYSASGFVVKDITINQSSKVLEGEKNLQAMLPYVRTLERESETLTEQNYFLVISHDGGEKWFFTDLKKYGAADIKLFIPEYNERLSIYLNSKHN